MRHPGAPRISILSFIKTLFGHGFAIALNVYIYILTGGEFVFTYGIFLLFIFYVLINLLRLLGNIF